MKRFLTGLWREEEGATMVEYGIMLALIAAVAIGIVMTLGTTTESAFTNINTEMNSAPTGGGE